MGVSISKQNLKIDEIIQEVIIYNTSDKIIEKIQSILNDIIVYEYDQQKLNNIISHIEVVNRNVKKISEPKTVSIEIKNNDIDRILRSIQISEHVKSFNITRSEIQTEQERQNKIKRNINSLKNYTKDEKTKSLLTRLRKMFPNFKNINKIKAILKNIVSNNNGNKSFIKSLKRVIKDVKNYYKRKSINGPKLYTNGSRESEALVQNLLNSPVIGYKNTRPILENTFKTIKVYKKESNEIEEPVQKLLNTPVLNYKIPTLQNILQFISIPIKESKNNDRLKQLNELLKKAKLLSMNKLPSLKVNLKVLSNPLSRNIDIKNAIQRIKRLMKLTNNETVKQVSQMLRKKGTQNIFISAKKILNKL